MTKEQEEELLADIAMEWAESFAENHQHACSSDMPPCPACENRIEKEDEREFGW